MQAFPANIYEEKDRRWRPKAPPSASLCISQPLTSVGRATTDPPHFKNQLRGQNEEIFHLSTTNTPDYGLARQLVNLGAGLEMPTPVAHKLNVCRILSGTEFTPAPGTIRVKIKRIKYQGFPPIITPLTGLKFTLFPNYNFQPYARPCGVKHYTKNNHIHEESM